MKSLHLQPIIVVAFLSSCTIGRHLTFQDRTAGPVYSITKTATVVVQDARENVLNGKEKTRFCGQVLSTAQIAYNVQTKSGQPLVDEFALAISKTYSKNGAIAEPIFVPINTAVDSVLGIFRKNANRERLLYFIIKKWESRSTPLFSSIRYELNYDILLSVYDKDGLLLASAQVHDFVTKQEGVIGSIASMQAMADSIFKEQLESLFNNPAVQKALQ